MEKLRSSQCNPINSLRPSRFPRRSVKSCRLLRPGRCQSFLALRCQSTGRCQSSLALRCQSTGRCQSSLALRCQSTGRCQSSLALRSKHWAVSIFLSSPVSLRATKFLPRLFVRMRFGRSNNLACYRIIFASCYNELKQIIKPYTIYCCVYPQI